MGNCLVTKLKGAVSNDELLKIGDLRLDIKEQSSNEGLCVQFFVTTTVRGLNGLILTAVNDNTKEPAQGSGTSSVVCEAATKYIITVASSQGTIIIPNKYELRSLTIPYHMEFDHASLYLPKVVVLRIDGDDIQLSDIPKNVAISNASDSNLTFGRGNKNKGFTGDFADLVDIMPNVVTFTYTGESSGSINALGTLKYVKSIYLTGYPFTGDLMAFVNTPCLTYLSIQGNYKVTGSKAAFAAERERLGLPAVTIDAPNVSE